MNDNQEQNARRERMLEKVRKLLSMGRDGRGNDTEQETAMRQANKLMAEFGIEEAEIDMAALNAGKMTFGEAQCGGDGKPPRPGHVSRDVPTWVGVLGVGVARFTDTVVLERTNAHGHMLVFQGERNDVIFARWLIHALVDSISEAQIESGWTRQKEKKDFKYGAACVLQRRLKALAAERRQQYAESTSRALVVLDRKMGEVARRFGETRTYGTQGRESGASIAGRDAGASMAIPTGRPISGNGSGQRRLK